jgi:hypothetical protein
MQYIVLEDSNGHNAAFKMDDFMAHLIANEQGLFGCELASLVTLKQGASGLGIPMAPQEMQQWFEQLAAMVDVIKAAGVEPTPEGLKAALAKIPAPAGAAKK